MTSKPDLHSPAVDPLGIYEDTHTNNTHPVFPSFPTRMGMEIESRCRSRCELFMLQDHQQSQPRELAFSAPEREAEMFFEDLGYSRGYRDAMIEVMSWVTGRDSDEILVELHDQVAGFECEHPPKVYVSRAPGPDSLANRERIARQSV